jgi:hypothetical protein
MNVSDDVVADVDTNKPGNSNKFTDKEKEKILPHID